MTPQPYAPSRATRAFRISSLFVPSWLAWYVAFSAPHPGQLEATVRDAIGPVWVLFGGALALRASAIAVGRGRTSSVSALERVDILTGRGVMLAWLSAVSIMAAVWLGFASLAVVGLLGTGVFHLVVASAFLGLRGRDPIHIDRVTRRFVTTGVKEGDAFVEEIVVDGARIPLGFRLFATGAIGPRWATSRHVLGAEQCGSRIVLESDVGPAIRGQHEPEPLHVWLEDVFGFCHSPHFLVASEAFVVPPKTRAIAKSELRPLLDHGIGPRAARQSRRLPTEGAFDLREYQQGDDVRRIHWVRSLAAGELVVRLPDELPPDRPRVRLVLDTFYPEAFALDCDAPGKMLDAMVGVWLALARSLSEAGARVTLVTVMGDWPGAKEVKLDFMPRSPDAAIDLGARVTWQNKLSVASLLTDDATYVVSRGVLATPPESGRVRWVVVMPELEDPAWPIKSELRMQFPVGSSENRWSFRKKTAALAGEARLEHARAVVGMRTNVAPAPAGSFVAFPFEDTVRLEAVR